MLPKLIIICAAAFILNLLWEEAHSVLYVHYKDAPITHLVLLRAALFDALLISLFSAPFLLRSNLNSWRGTPVLFVAALTVFAIGLEKWALGAGRWAYTDAMPLIPYLLVGLTPTIQLGLTGFFAFWFANKDWMEPR